MTYKPKICERCGAVFAPRTGNVKHCEPCRPLVKRERGYQYRNAHRDDMREYFKQYRDTHRGEMRAYDKEYSANHADKIQKRKKKYYLKNRDKILARCCKYGAKNPEIGRARVHRYRARKHGNGGDHTTQDERDLIRAQKYRCFYCNTLLFSTLDPHARHIEHIIGVANGGSNDPYNIVYSCADCNHIKRRLVNCADALLIELIKNGTLTGSQAFHKSFMLKTARERQTNPILFQARLRAEYRK